MIFLSCPFCCFLFVLELSAILLLLFYSFCCMHLHVLFLFCLLPCLTIVKFVKCSFIDVLCFIGVSEINSLT